MERPEFVTFYVPDKNIKTPGIGRIADAIGENLTKHGYTRKQNETLAGASGKLWRIDFHVHTAPRSALLQILSAENRAEAEIAVNRAYTAWSDLEHLASGPDGIRFVSLFDDLGTRAAKIWDETDFRLMARISVVVRWSEPDALFRHLLDGSEPLRPLPNVLEWERIKRGRRMA